MMGGPIEHPIARRDRDLADSSMLLARLVDDQHCHNAEQPGASPASAVLVAVAFLPHAEVVRLALAAVLALADHDTAQAPLCSTCRVPTYPDSVTASWAAHEAARRHRLPRQVYRCETGRGWHHGPHRRETPCAG